jgi:hypothetical protein
LKGYYLPCKGIISHNSVYEMVTDLSQPRWLLDGEWLLPLVYSITKRKPG